MSRQTDQDETTDPEVDAEENDGGEAAADAQNESLREEDYDSPEELVAALRMECEELRSKWVRARADYQNLRRRNQQEYESGMQRRMQPLLDELLLVMDYMDMALATPTTTEEAKNLAMGVELTREKLIGALAGEDVKPIPTDGPFDPALHEATGKVKADAEPGTIVETSRKGYTWRGIVLRHARVIIAEGAAPDEADEKAKD